MELFISSKYRHYISQHFSWGKWGVSGGHTSAQRSMDATVFLPVVAFQFNLARKYLIMNYVIEENVTVLENAKHTGCDSIEEETQIWSHCFACMYCSIMNIHNQGCQHHQLTSFSKNKYSRTHKWCLQNSRMFTENWWKGYKANNLESHATRPIPASLIS